MKFEFVPINKIERIHYTGKVYDLTVKNSHSYNINGIVVHNSVCETKTETGVYVPTAETIRECYQYKVENNCKSQIIADGGIRIPADLNKAMVLGADVAFCGSIFAGTKESPGDPILVDGVLHKLYRGAASFSVQTEATGEEPDYIEGKETLVKYKPGGVVKVIKKFHGGMVSSMSYFNSIALVEYRKKAIVEYL